MGTIHVEQRGRVLLATLDNPPHGRCTRAARCPSPTACVSSAPSSCRLGTAEAKEAMAAYQSELEATGELPGCDRATLDRALESGRFGG